MLKKFLLGLIGILILGAALLNFLPTKNKNLISPLLNRSKINLSDNIWLPKVGEVFGAESAPDISAQGAFFVDTQTGQVFYQKNPHQRLPIASLTKIMTVIVALENKKFSDSITISSEAANMEPDKMQLIEGEKLTVEELLDGIFTVSANDAAEALAENSVDGRGEFIKLMNQEAQQIGMKDTKFINPTGLEEDGVEQYSSAYDVALMSRYAIKHWPHLVDISSEPHIYLPVTTTHQDYDLYSGINLLTTYPGVVGFKTGYTPEAGLTLVTLARKEGHEVLGVLLGSGDRRDEARALLDYSFKSLGAKI